MDPDDAHIALILDLGRRNDPYVISLHIGDADETGLFEPVTAERDGTGWRGAARHEQLKSR